MSKFTTIISLFLLFSSLSSYGQKIKYKDLVLLLNAKEYEKAEPFLKKYLKDHDDNPNAYLFLGIIYQEKVAKEDVLKQTELIFQHADSAIFNFEIADKTINEKEVRRNDEYYSAYNRRDIRTGEFGVTLSDVKLDIEKRIQNLKAKKENVKKLKDSYLTAERLYSKSIKQFATIKQGLDENTFYLTSDENTIRSLKEFIVLYDSVISSFESYKNYSKLVGKTGYNQVIKYNPIKSFTQDGATETDFSKDELLLWDFKDWASKALAIIEVDIAKLRTELVQTDLAINQLGEMLKKDSVSVADKLKEVIPGSLTTRIKRFDENPIPLSVFALKIKEFEYGSAVLSHKREMDSSDLNLKVRLLKRELAVAKKMDSISTALKARDVEKEAMGYSDFITKSYGSTTVLKSLIDALKEYSKHEIVSKQDQLDRRLVSLKWITAGTDSIPLFSDSSIRKSAFRMLSIAPDKYTVGLKFGLDSLATGYFYSITPSRVPDVNVSFAVDKANFKKHSLPLMKSITIDDGKGQIYFSLLFSEEKVNDKFPVTIAKIYRSDGLAWSNNYSVESRPSALTFAPDTGELSIQLMNDKSEIKMMVVDKNGKVIK